VILLIRLLSAVLCLIAGGSVHATQQEELENLRQRISVLQQSFDKTNESKSEAADALRESERNISTSNRKLNELSQQQSQANIELGKLQKQSVQLEKEMAVEQTLLGKPQTAAQ
jgi:chromosome segregation ATPase